MKIVRAMKKQSRLIGEIKELQSRLSQCISAIEENDFPEDYNELMTILDTKVKDLITLKNRIMHTNIKHGMYSVILNLGEVKSRLGIIKEMNIEEGIQISRYGLTPEKTKYKSQISRQDKLKMIEEYQQRINDLTDKLDDFNALTDLETVEAEIEGF